MAATIGGVGFLTAYRLMSDQKLCEKGVEWETGKEIR
jgi:hypothetical protein